MSTVHITLITYYFDDWTMEMYLAFLGKKIRQMSDFQGSLHHTVPPFLYLQINSNVIKLSFQTQCNIDVVV
jgi:hypothetical protein